MSILLIIAFNLIVFFRTLRFTVITDDIKWYTIKQHGWPPFKHYRWRIHQLVADRLYGACTFLNIKWHFNTNVEIDHLVSIVIHTLICVLLYIATGSLLGALLYSCNPMNNQTSMWLNGRRYAVNIALVLLSLIAWQHHLWYLALPLWGYTGFFHYTAAFAPVLWGNAWLLLLSIPFMVIYRHEIMSKIVGRLKTLRSKELLIIFPRRIIVVIKTYGFYFFQMIFPTRTLMYYPELQFWGVTTEGNKDAYSFNLAFFKGLGAWVISVLGLCCLPDSLRPLCLFSILALLQWCNVMYAVATLADRYANMSLPFVMVILVKVISYIPDDLIKVILIGALFGYYLMSLSITMKMYPVIWEQYKYHIWRCPESVSGRIFYSNFLIKKQDYAMAWAVTEEGLRFHPNDFLLLYQAAQCWKGIGDKRQTMAYLLRCKENYYEGQEHEQGRAITDFIV